MKVRVSYVYYVLTLLLFFTATGLIRVLPVPIVNDIGNWRFLCLLYCILTFVKFGILCRGQALDKNSKLFMKIYFTSFILVMLVHFIYSMGKYSESVFDVLICSQGQFYVLGIFSFLYLFSEYGFDKFMRSLRTMLLGIVFIYLVAALLYSLTGVNIFDVGIRYGHLRLDPPFFGGVVFLYFFSCYLEKKKLRDFLTVIIYLVYLFALTGTRMEMIATVSGMVVIYFFKKKGASKQFFTVVFLILLFVVAYVNGTFSTVINSFSESAENGLSTTIRMRAIGYFSTIQRDNPLLGMSYVRGGVNQTWDYILYGQQGKYVYSDLGLLGFFYKVGYSSLIIIGLPLIRMAWCVAVSIKEKSTDRNSAAFILGLSIYFLVCQVSLGVTDVQRCLLLPFLWAYLEIMRGKATNHATKKYKN